MSFMFSGINDERHVDSHATQQATRRATQQATRMTLRLQTTSGPVWAEDEERERVARQRSGEVTVRDLGDDEAEEALRCVTLQLPERLIVRVVPDGAASIASDAGAGGNAVLPLTLDVTLCTTGDVTLRRLLLEMLLDTASGLPPVAVWMSPAAVVTKEERKVVDLAVDAGKLLPGPLGDVLTAKAGHEFEVEDIERRIEVFGRGCHIFGWRVSDVSTAYDFHPSVLVQHPASAGFTLSAVLHAEVRTHVLGVPWRTYVKTATPMLYTYQPGEPLLLPVQSPGQGIPAGASELTGDTLERFEADPEFARQVIETCRGQAEAGAVDAMMLVASALPEASDERWEWLQRAADCGHVPAMVQLALHPTTDRETSERWWRAAADKGDSQAMRELGVRLRSKDRPDAEHWLTAAAALGDIEAMSELGDLLATCGDRAADRWYRTAARHGSGSAQRALRERHPILSRAWARRWD